MKHADGLVPVLDNGRCRIDDCAIHVKQETGKRDALCGQRVIWLRAHDVGVAGCRRG